MKIQILPESVASQIAAGEVVERPASVVKELVENALDAGATHITVRVEQAGKRLIEVGDDGSGIAVDDLPLAVARHATSKLRTSEDLFRIKSLGFRGEALASIASVSRLTLTSRLAAAGRGGVLRVSGGVSGEVEPIGAPPGTVVQVENLFYNVPARRGFLKTDVTERRQMDALVTRYALAYPRVRFQLYHDGKSHLHTSGNGERREVLAGLYGVEVAKQMLEVSFEEDGRTIHGFISPLTLTRSNRREVTFFVNGRWVQDAALVSALLRAYRNLLMVGRFPLAVLFLELEAEQVDVNVHPAKAEVRFRQPEQIFHFVQRAVRRGLMVYSSLPQVSFPSWHSKTAPPTEVERRRPIDPGWEMAAVAGSDQPRAAGVESETDLQPTQPLVMPSRALPLLRLIGQVGATYLVAEGPDGLYLIDQHAAHERVLFERFLNQCAAGVALQTLLQPEVLQLSAADALRFEELLPLLNRIGFQVEPFGAGAFQVRAVPAWMDASKALMATRSLIEAFEEDELLFETQQETRLVARICKRAAIKGGQTLSVEEQSGLLRDLEACESPRTCPHGRPTMIHLSVDVLERQFGRRGSR